MKEMKKYLCVMMAVIYLLVLTGCGHALSAEEIQQANIAFRSETDSGSVSEISCFFTCYYSDPRKIDLQEFLKYCPARVMLTDEDEEEFQDWLATTQWADLGKEYSSPNDFLVPVKRYTKTDVSAILMKYAGITTDDLENTEGVVYMEKYDAFYNFTSDYAPGCFECVGGEINGSMIRFWSEMDQNGNRDVLTLEKVGEQYFIRSFQQEKTP